MHDHDFRSVNRLKDDDDASNFDRNNNTISTADKTKKSAVEPSKEHFQNRIRLSAPLKDADKSDKRSTNDDDLFDNVGEKLPVPTVSYDWCESPTYGSSGSSSSSRPNLPKSGWSYHFNAVVLNRCAINFF